MDRDDVPSLVEPHIGYVAQTKSAIAKLGISVQDAMLIAASWAALVAFILYPELQLMVFGVVVSGVAILNRTRKDV